jgi:hypothetical protein
MAFAAMGGNENLVKAIEHYSEAIRIQPDCAEAFVKRGIALRE